MKHYVLDESKRAASFVWSKKEIELLVVPKKHRVEDADPRTLYVYRPVTNWQDIAKWAKAQGFKTTLGSDMHVTICYSKQPVDWMKVGEDFSNDDGSIAVRAGGPRMLDQFGDATVLLFASSKLSWRHEEIKRNAGASWDFDSYQPHITITYESPSDLDITKVAAYNGPIEFGPEVFEEIKDDYRSEVVEDGVVPFVDYSPDQPREPAGSPSGW